MGNLKLWWIHVNGKEVIGAWNRDKGIFWDRGDMIPDFHVVDEQGTRNKDTVCTKWCQSMHQSVEGVKLWRNTCTDSRFVINGAHKLRLRVHKGISEMLQVHKLWHHVSTEVEIYQLTCRVCQVLTACKKSRSWFVWSSRCCHHFLL